MKNLSATSITLSDGGMKETATYMENDVSMKIETIMRDGKVTELSIYADGKEIVYQNYNHENAILELNFNPNARGAYDYLTFTSYRLVNSWSGNTQLDNLYSSTVITALVTITGYLVGAEKLAGFANIIINYYLNCGYYTSSKVNLSYNANKYWSNSTNTNVDTVFRTKFVYTYYNLSGKYITQETEEMYTSNNPI